MNNNYVLITGAYGGLGKALAHRFAEASYGIILLGRNSGKLMQFTAELPDTVPVKSLVCDVSDWEDCQKAYRQVKTWQINIKVLINNAGITYIHELDKAYDMARFRDLIQTNLYGPVYLSQLFLEDLIQNKGSIINISSVIGYAPVLGRTAYAASKFGMEGFFSVLAAERQDSLHVLMVYPTFIHTDIRKAVPGDKTVNEVLTPESVAERVYRAFTQRKARIYIGKTAKLSYYLYKFAPKMYVRKMRQKINRQKQ